MRLVKYMLLTVSILLLYSLYCVGLKGQTVRLFGLGFFAQINSTLDSGFEANTILMAFLFSQSHPNKSELPLIQH